MSFHYHSETNYLEYKQDHKVERKQVIYYFNFDWRSDFVKKILNQTESFEKILQDVSFNHRGPIYYWIKFQDHEEFNSLTGHKRYHIVIEIRIFLFLIIRYLLYMLKMLFFLSIVG